jgi:hypothetical protein
MGINIPIIGHLASFGIRWRIVQRKIMEARVTLGTSSKVSVVLNLKIKQDLVDHKHYQTRRHGDVPKRSIIR